MIGVGGLLRRSAPLLLVLLTACGGKSTRPELPNTPIQRSAPSSELYAPHRLDGGPPEPPNIARMAEPIPVPEPRARYGNRSPYKVLGKTYHVLDSAHGYAQRGKASWYGNKFHGRPTSSFEPYDMYKFTAAHKTLPLPSFVRVTNLENGRSVVVRVNDRGPFHGERIIDLSYAAAVRLGMHTKGVAEVQVVALDPEGDSLAADRRVSERPVAGRSGHAGSPRTYRSAISAPRVASAPENARKPVRRYLQVGSFASKDNAKRLEDQLEEAGLDAVHLQTAKVGGNKVWRVRVGPLGDDALSRARDRVLALGLAEPRIVSE